MATALRVAVDEDIRQRKIDAWHYESRIKTLESFALKVETGRIASLAEIEDVFAATIVVPEWSQIAEAEALVLERYELHERRPSPGPGTSKSSDRFLFDDVRLFVRYRRAESERSEIRDGLLFEIQVKTFLQHAWAVATHDVVYKTPSRDWRRERVAFQVRASLESAEVAIGNIESLAKSPILPSEDPEIAELNATIAILKEHWGPELLPTNLRRLAENVQMLMLVAAGRYDNGRPEKLRALLDAGKERNAGAHNLNWSPYRSVLNYVAKDYKGQLKHRVTDTKAKKKLVVYPEVLDALSIPSGEAVAALIVGG